MKTCIIRLMIFVAWALFNTVDSHAQHVTRSYSDADTAGSNTPVFRSYTDKRNAIKGSIYFTRASLRMNTR